MEKAAKDAHKTIAIIDGNSLMHRAFHAVPPYMTAPDGVPTNAVFGFMQMLIKLIETFSVWGIYVCFDKGKPRARMEILPQYKANRPPQDESLHVQFPLVKDLLAALSIPVVELEGWEGDDLLGTIAKRAASQNMYSLLFTGDRDMYQLSDEYVKIVTTKKGMSEVAIMDPEAVEDLYAGITPELIPDFYGLKGDSSDNIPGVPGVGPKKAAALIQEFGSLEEVLAHADEIPGKMGENIREHKEDALLSRKVATIQCDAPVELDFAACQFPNFDEQKATEAFARLAFNTIEKRFFVATNTDVSHNVTCADSSLEQLKLPQALENDAAQKELERVLHTSEWVGVGFGQLDTPQLFVDNDVLYVQTAHSLLKFYGNESKAVLARLVEVQQVSAIDIKQLLHVLVPVDSDVPSAIDVNTLAASNFFDCSIAAYLLNSSLGTYDAASLAERYLSASLDKKTNIAAATAHIAFELREPLKKLLEENGSMTCFEQIEMPLVLVLVAMERRGLEIDKTVLYEQTQELTQELSRVEAAIYAEAGEEFNIGSPEQLSHVLFDVLHLPHEGLKRTKKGFISTNAQVLDKLAKDHKIVQNILAWREISKIITTYLEPLPQVTLSDGRVHTTFNQTVTTTGRLSSSNPNLQNIPVKSELGKRVRKAFTVSKKHFFLAADYSQIELRLLAHLSQDAELISAFNNGKDFHTETAARVFNISPNSVSAEARRHAKAVNFGIVYGQQAFGLAKALDIPLKEAQAMIDAYYNAYPAVRAYLDRIVSQAHREGFAETMYGRRRLLPELAAQNRMLKAAGEREAMNLPMQGSAADIIKLAMIAVEQALHQGKYRTKLILQIHDELDLEVPEDELDDIIALVRANMESVVDLSVPLAVDISYGANWAEAK